MLIRSQNKNTLINLDRIKIIDIRNLSSGEASIIADDIRIGIYSNPGKCQKVFDMIVDANRKDRQLVPVTVEAGPTSITQFAIFEPQTFQMPQDKEVQDV